MANSSFSQLHFFKEPIMIFVVVIVFVVALILFPIEKAISFTVLIGLWFLDVFIKHSIGLSNRTLFADLSFSSFVFTGGQSLALLSSKALDQNETVMLGALTFFLFLFWLGNLSLCKLPGRRPRNGGRPSLNVIIGVSLFFAILSVTGMLVSIGIG